MQYLPGLVWEICGTYGKFQKVKTVAFSTFWNYFVYFMFSVSDKTKQQVIL